MTKQLGLLTNSGPGREMKCAIGAECQINVKLNAEGIRYGFSRLTPENLANVALGLFVRRHTAVFRDRLRPGVVRRERQSPRAESSVLLGKITSAAIQVLLRIARINAKCARCRRHKLRQTYCALVRARPRTRFR